MARTALYYVANRNAFDSLDTFKYSEAASMHATVLAQGATSEDPVYVVKVIEIVTKPREAITHVG